MARPLFLSLFAFALPLGTAGCSPRTTTTAQCTINSDCTGGLRCLLGQCRVECTANVDCDRSGGVCLVADGGSAGYCSATPDAGTSDADAAPPVDTATRPLAPLSTSRVGSARPTLRWRPGATEPGPSGVQLCRNRSLSAGCQLLPVSGGTSVRPASALAAGTWYWQLRGTSRGANAPVWQFTVDRRDTAVDTSWGSTLDANGDGYADAAVGAYDLAGAAYLYVGGPSGLPPSPSVSLRGRDGDGGFFGCSIASAGDVNGDGFGDLLIGAYGAGRAYLYLGSAAGLQATPTTLTTANGAGGQFGYTVASAGDLNGDGYADVVIGARAMAGGGGAFVFYGSPGGLPSAPSVSLTAPDGVGGDFGYAVASAGDLDGDGFSELAVGSFSAGGYRGRAYLYAGGAAGVSATPTLTFAPPSGAPGQFGVAVANAGDLNGDGYSDLAIGADGNDETAAGALYYFLGSAAGVDPAAARVLRGGAGFFASSLSSAGDLDGDGFEDLLVGSYHRNSRAGLVQLFRGSPTSLSASPSVTFAPRGGAGDYYGWGVAGAGDLNGDGFLDVLVGAYGALGDTGEAYVYLGGLSGIASTPSQVLSAPSESRGEFGVSVASFLRPRARQPAVQLGAARRRTG